MAIAIQAFLRWQCGDEGGGAKEAHDYGHLHEGDSEYE
jgi:hypothetical protein